MQNKGQERGQTFISSYDDCAYSNINSSFPNNFEQQYSFRRSLKNPEYIKIEGFEREIEWRIGVY